ncbi:MAG: serine hydrolase domain-containing protein [Gemmatimonadales bacterium]
MRLLFSLAASAALAVTGAAQPPSPSAAPERGLRGAAELEAFVDGMMTAYLHDHHVAGAVVTVVGQGEIVLSKGYGYADVGRREPVDPDRTLFRVGSVSKLFTWTAVMQLVEQGKLDLEADVNGYLDFEIPSTYPEAITLRHLMTHTAGFEEDPRGLISEDSTAIGPMGPWLVAHLPARVRPPGHSSSYSNWGTALAGYIVERIAGEPFSDYVARHILEPLGMTDATAHQPLPPRLASQMSGGYEWSGGAFLPHGFEYLPGAAPAGVVSASGTAMGRFMLAHLQHGALGDARILADSTARRMHARAFGHHPGVNGFALGFYEKSSHGLRIIGHGGDSQWFHTDLALIPSEQVGLFVSFNTDTGGALSFAEVLNAFLNHYYPSVPSTLAVSPESVAESERVAGTYRNNRRGYSNYFKAFALAGATTVALADDSTLTVTGSDGPWTMVRVGPLLFRERDGDALMAFGADPDGRITRAFIGQDPTSALERVSWSELGGLHFAILGIGGIVFLTMTLAAVRRLWRPGPATPPWHRAARRWFAAAAACFVGFLIAMAILAGNLVSLILGGDETGIKTALALPVLGSLSAAVAVIVGVRGALRPESPTGARIRFALSAVMAALFVWSLAQWNLLGWKL